VWRQIALCVVFGGCGFQSQVTGDGAVPPLDAAEGDSPVHPMDAAMTMDGAMTPDAATDASIDAPPAPRDCFAQWLNGRVTFSMPAELMGVNTTGTERDPWVSDDGFRLYFTRGAAEHGDIFQASRQVASGAFSNVAKAVNLSTDSDDSRASLTPDEMMLALASNRRGGGVEILISRDGSGTPDGVHLDKVNEGGGDRFDPFLAANGTRLYFAPTQPSRQHLALATRASTNDDFSMPIELPGISDKSNPDADPAVSRDERILVYSSQRNGGGFTGFNLWYATRADVESNFSAPKPIPMVNSNQDDADPMLSADGCELYFASNKGATNDNYNLYFARVMPSP
jgi:Tol biopolymer transport system component